MSFLCKDTWNISIEPEIERGAHRQQAKKISCISVYHNLGETKFWFINKNEIIQVVMSIKSILYYHIIVNVKAYYAFDKSQSDDINRYQGAKYF